MPRAEDPQLLPQEGRLGWSAVQAEAGRHSAGELSMSRTRGSSRRPVFQGLVADSERTDKWAEIKPRMALFVSLRSLDVDLTVYRDAWKDLPAKDMTGFGF